MNRRPPFNVTVPFISVATVSRLQMRKQPKWIYTFIKNHTIIETNLMLLKGRKAIEETDLMLIVATCPLNGVLRSYVTASVFVDAHEQNSLQKQ